MSKTLAQLLETKDKNEQVKRVQMLVDNYGKPAWTLTIVVHNNKVNFGLVGAPHPQEALDALSLVRDAILTEIAKQQEQQQEQQVMEALAGLPNEPQDDEGKTQVYYKE